jgi:hypothetical protein
MLMPHRLLTSTIEHLLKSLIRLAPIMKRRRRFQRLAKLAVPSW